MIKPIKIFYSPSKNSSNRKKKNLSSSSKSDKKVTAIKNKQKMISNSPYKDKDQELILEKKEKEAINKINDTLLFLNSKKINEDSIKSKHINNASSYSSLFVDKLKKNQKLKERNIYLKNIAKELRNSFNTKINKINIIQNNQYIKNNIKNNLTYYNTLKKENSELNYINKNLKEEYSMLKLQQNNNLSIKNILTNKEEIESKIKLLNYSLNSFLELISNSPSSGIEKTISGKSLINHNRIHYSNKKRNDNELILEKENLKKNGLYKDGRNYKKNFNNNPKFTEGENLNINIKENNKNEKEMNDNESYEDFKIVIPLKQFEKTEINKFQNYKKLGNINPDYNLSNRLVFSNNNLINSNIRSIENNNHIQKNYKFKALNANKNKLPFKINNNFINQSIMNKSAKSIQMNKKGGASNIRPEKMNLKSKEKRIKKKESNIKHSDYILKKYNKIFEKPSIKKWIYK